MVQMMGGNMTAQTQALRMTGQAAPRAGAVAGLRGRIAPLIAGLAELVPQAGGARERSVVRAPFTGEAIGSAPACTAEDVALAVERARAAQHAWAETSLEYRRAIFLRYHDLVLDHQEQLLDLIQIEGGKARRHALEEIFDVAINCALLRLSRGRVSASPSPPAPSADPRPGLGISPPRGRGRHHRAVELPVDRSDIGRHPGAACRQRCSAEAR